MCFWPSSQANSYSFLSAMLVAHALKLFHSLANISCYIKFKCSLKSISNRDKISSK